MTTIYNYDASGVYVGSTFAQKCPLTGVDLLPANSTEIEPPDTIPPHIPIFDGQKWGVFAPEIPEKTQEQKAAEQYFAIDNLILSKLKDHDYDSVGELALAASGGQWQEEAQILNLWVQECWEIMDKIKNGVITFDSVHDALLSLPD